MERTVDGGQGRVNCPAPTKKQHTGPLKKSGPHWLEWITLTTPTPCQTCRFHDYCAATHAACGDWHHYVETGELLERVRNPKAGKA